MTATKQIDEWIAKYGCERDALNVALARIMALEAERDYWCTSFDALDALTGCAKPEPAFDKNAVGELIDELVDATSNQTSASEWGFGTASANRRANEALSAIRAALGIDD